MGKWRKNITSEEKQDKRAEEKDKIAAG